MKFCKHADLLLSKINGKVTCSTFLNKGLVPNEEIEAILEQLKADGYLQQQCEYFLTPIGEYQRNDKPYIKKWWKEKIIITATLTAAIMSVVNLMVR